MGGYFQGFLEHFLLKNPQISYPFQYLVLKSLHSLKYLRIFSQILVGVHFEKN